MAAVAVMASCQDGGLVRYVNPLVGTDFHGHTYPGAIAPFGQIQPSPDTRLEGWDGCSAYHYSDDTVYGFSHTHLSGTGCEDYGDILLMPVVDEHTQWQFTQDLPREEYLSTFKHRSEKATAGYYRVVLDRNRVMVELTASERVACHRYSFPGPGRKGIVVDLQHRDKVIAANFESNSPEGMLCGWRESNAWNPDQKCFFALETNKPYKSIKFFANGTKALIELDEDCKEIEVYVSISGVDCEGARKNLGTREGKSFDDIHNATIQRWEEKLGKIAVEGGSRRERRNFYTALYHCYTSPYLWSDADGRYRGMDDSIHTSQKPIYTVFSLWDTYRAFNPLMAILEPAITEEWVNTMLTQFEQGGELTMWELSAHETHCMIGYHACPVILEAQKAGILDSWTPERRLALLKAMVATSNRTEAHQAYAAQGYLDSQEDNESVSKTLEYAYDDWCIATFALNEAARQGKKADSTNSYYNEVAKTYMRRANSWQNVMDANGFMHARRNGGFITPFNPTEVNNHYTESNSWQASTYVPHDIPTWIERMGGKAKAEAFLDSLFNTSSETTGREQSDITGMIGQYAHGNEPSHHAAYLYAYLGATDKLQKVVDEIRKELYTPAPDGLCGNEDCGQMSAWYVMSAMGFYPVCPGSGEYVTVAPVFDKVTIHRENAAEDIFIDKKQWEPGMFWRDGAFYDSTIVVMDDEYHQTPAPYFTDWQPRFEDSTFVSLAINENISGSTRIYYTLDGSTPDTHAYRYAKPFLVNRDITIRAVAYNENNGYSPVVTQTMKRFIADKRLRYITKPEPQYMENGPEGLIDRLYGTTNYRIGGWQGWQSDMEVVIDLLQNKSLSSVGVDCLENMRSWIFFPSKIEVSVSNDGKTFAPWGTVENKEFPTTLERQEESVQHTFTCHGPYVSARYVKVKAYNHGALPDWHVSAGQQAWIFVDEIEVGSYIPTFINSFESAE